MIGEDEVTNRFSIDRSRLTLKQRFEIVMTNLNAAYEKLRPGSTRDDFNAAITHRVQDMGAHGNGDAQLRFLAGLRGDGLPVDETLASIYISCGYAVQAMYALRDGKEPELVNSLMIDAFYWAGTLTNVGDVEKMRKALRTEQGTLGGKGRDKLYQPVREWSIKVALCQQWSSRSHAAKYIQSLLEGAEPNKDWAISPPDKAWPKLAKSQAVRTISKWLADPRVAKSFPLRRRAASKKSP